jgi:hypothetical protein
MVTSLKKGKKKNATAETENKEGKSNEALGCL